MDVNSLLIKAVHEKRLAQVAAELLASRITDLSERETSVIRAANSVCSNIRDLILRFRGDKPAQVSNGLGTEPS